MAQNASAVAPCVPERPQRLRRPPVRYSPEVTGKFADDFSDSDTELGSDEFDGSSSSSDEDSDSDDSFINDDSDEGDEQHDESTDESDDEDSDASEHLP